MFVVERKLGQAVQILDGNNEVIAEITIKNILSNKKMKLGFIVCDPYKINRIESQELSKKKDTQC